MNKMRLQESVVLFAAKDRCNWVFFFDPSFGLCLLGLEDFDTGVKYSPQLSFGLESASVFHADHSPIQKGNGRDLQGFHHLFCVRPLVKSLYEGGMSKRADQKLDRPFPDKLAVLDVGSPLDFRLAERSKKIRIQAGNYPSHLTKLTVKTIHFIIAEPKNTSTRKREEHDRIAQTSSEDSGGTGTVPCLMADTVPGGGLQGR